MSILIQMPSWNLENNISGIVKTLFAGKCTERFFWVKIFGFTQKTVKNQRYLGKVFQNQGNFGNCLLRRASQGRFIFASTALALLSFSSDTKIW